MNKSFGQNALYGLAAVLFSITGNGMAQDAGLSVSGCPAGAACGEQRAAIAFKDGPVLEGGQVGVITTDGMGMAFKENAEVVKNQPYQAQAVTEVKQTLADGSHISQSTTASVARDSDGRTVRIQKMSTIGPWKSASDSSQADGPTLTTIFDPVARTHIDYTSDRKTAHVLPMPPREPGAAQGEVHSFAAFAGGPGAGGPGPMTFSMRGGPDSPQLANSGNAKTESLGSKSIEGVPVTGTKTTETIPAGAIGNDKDLVVTRETWYSPDLKLVLQSTQTDPRFGETTYSLTNVQRNEPDPTLFQVPAGYTVEKVPMVMRKTAD